MLRGKLSHLFKLILLGYGLFSAPLIYSEIIGNPPYKVINIPSTEYGYHFDLAIDNDKTLYVAYERGVKIFDGANWQEVYIGEDANIRRLYFNQNDRVYFGGADIIGYVYKDAFGVYQFKQLTPKSNHLPFTDIWHITECEDDIIFMSLHSVFLFNQNDESIRNWDFDGKLGSGFCYNHVLTVQDRSSGLKQLQNDKWVTSPIELKNNTPIDRFQAIDEDTYFILSLSDDWRILQNNQIKVIQFDKALPNLDNYVASASIGDGKLVLGSNNGLLTFIDVNNAQAQSFQLTNEWISKIIKTDEGLIILTEFEIYYMQWPSAIRLQGKDSGLASSLMDVIKWNNKTYVVGSAGVFLEDKQQLVYQHKLFKRLNWTNKEAWFLKPLNKTQALLAESHKLLLIETEGNSFKQTAISDVIYPRELIQSRYNANLFYVITEFDTQLLLKDHDSWLFKPLYENRATSIIENEAGYVLLSSIEEGVLQIKMDIENAQVQKQSSISQDYQLQQMNGEVEGLLLTQQQRIYAYNTQGIYHMQKNQSPEAVFPNLTKLLKGEKINKFLQADDGLFYGFTFFKFFYQDALKQWQVIDMAPYIKGIIANITLIDDQVKILSNGMLITFLKDQAAALKTSNYSLRVTHINLKQNNKELSLPINAKHLIEIDQDNAVLTFTYVLNDVKNHNNNLYRFKLSGESNEWSDFTHNNKINISNIASGTYALDIQAKDINNKIHSAPSYQIVVNPPWYWSHWAFALWVILSLIIVAVMIYLLIKWREKIHESQKQELKHIINDKTQALKLANTKLQKMAHLDGLTGLSNRFYLDEFIKNTSDQSIKSLCVLMMDMDDFKYYNDQNGHIAGDELLKHLAQFLLHSIDRASDVTARYGGEEFLVILLDCDLAYCQAKAEEIRGFIEDKVNKTSVSMGISYTDKNTDMNCIDAIYHLIDLADQAMYEAKKAGKNQIKLCKDCYIE